jgi:hypothetical protein
VTWLNVCHDSASLAWINRLDANPVTHMNRCSPMGQAGAARAEQSPWASGRCGIQLDLQVVGLKRHHDP